MNQVTIYHGDEVIRTHNRICKGFENWRRATIKSIITKNFGGDERFPTASTSLFPFSFCALLTETGTSSYPLGEVIATANVGQTENMTQKKGSINSSESYCTFKKMHLVFDFGTQVEGTIKGIVFSSSSSSFSFYDANQGQADMLKKAEVDGKKGSVQGDYFYYLKNKKIYRIHLTDSGGEEEVCTIEGNVPANSRTFRRMDESFVLISYNNVYKVSKTGQLTETTTIGAYGGALCASEDGTYYGYKDGVIKHYADNGTEIQEDQIVLDRGKIIGSEWRGDEMDYKNNVFLLFPREGSSDSGCLYFEKGKMPAMSLTVPSFFLSQSTSPIRSRIIGLIDKNKIFVSAGKYIGKMSTEGVSSAIDLETPIVKDNTKTLKVVYDLNFDSLF